MLKSLTDFSDGNLPVPSLLLQEELEQTDLQQSRPLFLTHLLHAVDMLSGDPSPESSSDIWCDVSGKSQKEKTKPLLVSKMTHIKAQCSRVIF